MDETLQIMQKLFLDRNAESCIVALYEIQEALEQKGMELTDQFIEDFEKYIRHLEAELAR